MPTSTREAVGRVIVGGLTLAYPFAVFAGIGRLSASTFALGLAAVALARAAIDRSRPTLAIAAGALVLALASVATGGWVPLKLYPVLVNATLLAVFGASLVRPPTVVERLARLTTPELPPEGVAYTRRVTQAWCAFFALNGAISAGTALLGSEAAWALYNGLVAYVLIGLLAGGEWLVRRRVLRGVRDA